MFIKKQKILSYENTKLNLNLYTDCRYCDKGDIIWIKDMLKHVTELQMKILVLKFIKNYSYTEIAEDLDICRQAINRIKIGIY